MSVAPEVFGMGIGRTELGGKEKQLTRRNRGLSQECTADGRRSQMQQRGIARWGGSGVGSGSEEE